MAPVAPAPQEPIAPAPAVDPNIAQQADPGIDTSNLGAQDFSQTNTATDMSGDQQSPDISANANMGDDEENPFRVIQKMTGKLTQRMRDNEQGMSDKQYKYIINSILSAVDSTKLSDGDKKSIMSKLNGQDQSQEGGMQQGGSPEDLSEVDDEMMDHEPEPEARSEHSKLIMSPIIKKILDKAGINPAHEDMDILAFDVAEAMHVYIHDYNEDIPFIHYLKALLNTYKFTSRPSLNNYNNLDPDGKDIYLALVQIGEEPNEIMNENKKIIYKSMITEIKWKLRKK